MRRHRQGHDGRYRMSKRWYYQEELFFSTEDESLDPENQNKIVEMLGKNVAVGVVSGFYGGGFPLYFISSFALNNMGMDYQQFVERTGGDWLEAVYPADRKIFTRVCPPGEEDVREYRVFNAAGEPVWMREVRTESVARDGRHIWIGAIRLIDAEHRGSLLMQEAFQMLQDAYFRISAIDLSKNAIENLKFMESEALEVERFGGDYRMTITSCAENHVAQEDRKNFKKIMAADNLKKVFLDGSKGIHFNYLRLVNGEWKWVRAELVPVEGFSEENARVMWYVKNISEEKAKETQMTDRLLRTNAELVQAKKELERANEKIRESNYALRRTLSAEEQYRQAIISEAVFVYHVNVTRNLIEEEFYEIVNGQMRPVLAQMGMEAPCNADEFYLRYSKTKVFPEDRELFVQTLNARQLLESYERGENEIVLEFEIFGTDENAIALRHVILLTRDMVSGDLLALNNVRNITANRKKDREARRALLDAYEAADRASCAKADFLSKMSHDIRTPMNAIIGMTALAGSRLRDPDRVAECLRKVSTASRHMLSLVNEMLDMSRIESGTLSLHEEEFNLQEMLENLVNMMEPVAQEKRQLLKVHCHGFQHTNVQGDFLRIQQAFMNVLNNAIIYTPEGGEISIDITEKPSAQSQIGCYEFVFRDNGVGMTRDFLERIYEPFERAEDSRISKIHGAGLGLTISRNIVQLMGGDICVESEPGLGTEVTITLPLKYQGSQQTEQTELTGRRVLVINDDPFSCERICVLLQKIGMSGERALSGADALDCLLQTQARKEELFAILLEWGISDMGGMDMVRAIRTQANTKAPIVVISDADLGEAEMEARLAGVDAFVRRPIDKSGLSNIFKSFLHREDMPAPEHSLDSVESADYSGRRILVVEDNDLNREIATEILAMTGAQVEAAENGKVAVDMVMASEKNYYDLILMDLQMPVMNGYEATRALRMAEREDVRNLPIVAMTANAFLEDVQKSKACGMNEHMAKPLDMEQLLQMLSRWLGRKQ